MLKALAVLEQTDIAVVNKCPENTERTRVFCADGFSCKTFSSWRKELVPRLRKQQKGAALGNMRVSQRHGGQRSGPVRPLRVVVFDGSAHYDGTRPLESSALHDA